MADYSITGDTRLDASGFNKGLSAMSVAAGNLISGLTQAATGKLTELGLIFYENRRFCIPDVKALERFRRQAD